MKEELDHSPGLRDPEPPRQFPAVLAVVALAVALGALGIYFKLRTNPPSPSAARPGPSAPAASTPDAAADSMGAPVDPALPPLPGLDASDESLRALLEPFAPASDWSAWLRGEGLVRRFAAGALALREGRIPRTLLELVPSRGPFEVERAGARLFVAESTHARYEPVMATLESIDLDRAARVWTWGRPLAEQAWREIAPSELALTESIREAIDHLLSTPVPPARIEVTGAAGAYRFLDPRFEDLSAARKLLLRMGAARGERLRAWLVRVRNRL